MGWDVNEGEKFTRYSIRNNEKIVSKKRALIFFCGGGKQTRLVSTSLFLFHGHFFGEKDANKKLH